MTSAVDLVPALTIHGDRVRYVTPEGQEFDVSLDDLLQLVQQAFFECRIGVLPPEVCCVILRGSVTIWVGQHAPCVRTMNWITDDSPAPFGPEATYSLRSIALPYVVIVAAFVDGVLSNMNECFFTTVPLTEWTDELFFPSLLNVSRFPDQTKKPLSWICTQHLNFARLRRERDRVRRMRLGWQLLGECLFSDSFNRSSEFHEGASYFELSRQVDGRISKIDCWEEATRADPLFILDVPFLKTGYTLEQVVTRTLENLGEAPGSVTASDLARLVVNHAAAMPRRPR
jgi:hypothetical protein